MGGSSPNFIMEFQGSNLILIYSWQTLGFLPDAIQVIPEFVPCCTPREKYWFQAKATSENYIWGA